MRRNPRPAVALLAAAVTVACASLVTAFAFAAGNEATASAAKAANAKYHDLSVAEQAGYSLLKDKKGIACIAMPATPGMQMGAMGVHWAKGPYVADGKIEPLEPEALVYAPDHGTLRLAAVEYVVLKASWDAKHAAAPVLFGHQFNVVPAGNRFGLPALYALHVWLWKHDPAGEFSMWNPEVHCK